MVKGQTDLSVRFSKEARTPRGLLQKLAMVPSVSEVS